MVWISVAWIAYEMYFKVTDQYNEKWQYDWITSDFWCDATPRSSCLYFLPVLCGVPLSLCEYVIAAPWQQHQGNASKCMMGVAQAQSAYSTLICNAGMH